MPKDFPPPINIRVFDSRFGKSLIGLHEIQSLEKFEVPAAESQSHGESSTRRKHSSLLFLPFFILNSKRNHWTVSVPADDTERQSTEVKRKKSAKTDQEVIVTEQHSKENEIRLNASWKQNNNLERSLNVVYEDTGRENVRFVLVKFLAKI